MHSFKVMVKQRDLDHGHHMAPGPGGKRLLIGLCNESIKDLANSWLIIMLEMFVINIHSLDLWIWIAGLNNPWAGQTTFSLGSRCASPSSSWSCSATSSPAFGAKNNKKGTIYRLTKKYFDTQSQCYKNEGLSRVLSKQALLAWEIIELVKQPFHWDQGVHLPLHYSHARSLISCFQCKKQ